MRCTKAVLYKENLVHNIKEIQKIVGDKKICVAVKARGYGHDAIFVAKTAEKLGVEYLSVATVDEGIELRQNGIKTKILLFSLCAKNEMENLFRYEITPFVFSGDYICAISKSADDFFGNSNKKHDVFLAIDTGMGRIGCFSQNAGNEAVLIEKSNHLHLGGVCSHFSVADSLLNENQEYTDLQIKSFEVAIENIKKMGINPGVRSFANSPAILNIPNAHYDLVRPGIITYGYYPDDISYDFLQSKGKNIELKPVLSLETQVVAIKKFPKGKSISYGRIWTTQNETNIAILPIGYADGLLRRFSPGLFVTINNKNYPIVGRICMDQCMVDLGENLDNVKIWDKVLIFGPKESGAKNTAEDLAKLGNTISYEILTCISERVKRIIKEENDNLC